MSKRWFILAFSILFLFAFRVWINDLSSGYHEPLVRNAEDIQLVENHQLLIFPASMGFNTFFSDGLNFLRIANGNAGLPGTALFSGNESRYIFPTWPDTLAFSFKDVLVDNYDFLNSYVNSELDLRDK